MQVLAVAVCSACFCYFLGRLLGSIERERAQIHRDRAAMLKAYESIDAERAQMEREREAIRGAFDAIEAERIQMEKERSLLRASSRAGDKAFEAFKRIPDALRQAAQQPAPTREVLFGIANALDRMVANSAGTNSPGGSA